MVLVSGFVIHGQQVNEQKPVHSSTAIGESDSTINPLDQLSSADIAVHIARFSGLEQATAVTNKADTVNAQLTISSTDEKVVDKPQIVSAGLKSRQDIEKYTTQEGDTVSDIATRFGVTSDTIRWSNNITEEELSAGRELLISPVNGIVYQVGAGDTIESIASTYRANKDMLIAINDAEIDGLPPVGEYIIIPDGSPPMPASSEHTPTNAARGSGFAWGGSSPRYAQYGGAGYAYGYCTWYAALKRAEIGRPIPSNLGNASTWKVLSQRAGLGVGREPQAGAVIWTPPRDYYGHVGFVEEVYPDGRVRISEMNVVGWGRVSTNTLTPVQAAGYFYIY